MARAFVTVIGAGVAGLTVALELAERGAGVTVLDKGPAPGPQACSWYAGGMIPEKPRDISQPYFLNDAVLDFPDTALKATFSEIGHLFRNAADYIGKGIGLESEEIRSNKDLNQLLQSSRPLSDIDFDDLYERRIKNLYGAIVEFASEAEPKMLPEQVEALDAGKTIVRDIVQAVKDVKHLQKNVTRFFDSENDEIRQQYATLRLRIAEVLRAVSQVELDRETYLQALDMRVKLRHQ